VCTDTCFYAAFEDCYRIFGTLGTLDFPKMVVWRYKGEGEQGWGDPISSERYGVRESPPLVNQLRHFCEMIRNDVPSRCSGEEAIKSLQAINAVIHAMNTGKAVKL